MKIVWSEESVTDLKSWRKYMKPRNPKVGEAVISRVIYMIKKIEAMPLMGKPGRVPGTREYKVGGTPLSIVYGIHDNLICIIHIHHDRQQWPK